jgi:DNA-directed RNA polymerase specialized sigma24 family protein
MKRSDDSPIFFRTRPHEAPWCAYPGSETSATVMADREFALALLSQAMESREATPLEEAVAAKLVNDMNLLRLKAAARFLARGLSPDIYWWDLLQEAVARVLNGSRRCPADVPVDIFMIGVMRSIRAEHWRRRSILNVSTRFREAEMLDPAPDPERVLLAEQELKAIGALFADDAVVTNIIAGLADGRTAEEIRTKYGISNTEYDSARKRMRRALLRDSIRSKLA